jgi:RNA polymerase sigma-70 factor (ECF subfamily)
MTETEVLQAAQAGDAEAYNQLVAPLRAELHAHCYRMLGSNADADDAVQEALVRAWRGLPEFEARSSVRSWLYRIATNVCLSASERASRRVLPVDFGPAADPHDARRAPITEAVWVEPYAFGIGAAPETGSPEARYDSRESVELAFVAALQYLPANQRAALILRDVLGFSASEAATMLETSQASVNSALQRAHKTVDDRLPARSQRDTIRRLGDEKVANVAERYIDAWHRSDVHALVELLVDDAIFSMPPLSEWYVGSEVIAEFLARRPMAPPRRWHLERMDLNGQVAFANYGWTQESHSFVPHGVTLLTLRQSKIAEIITYLDPTLFAPLGLPVIPVHPPEPSV